MRNLDKKRYILDVVGLISIGLFSIGYVVFVRLFAELHLQFSFLDFPIFVGEMLLFGCLILFLAKYCNNFPRLRWGHYLIICYFAFVLVKALYGYLEWGPLALRHSALMYYPVFAVFGYSFYRRKFFDLKACSVLPLLIVFVFIDGSFCSYWTVALAVLGFILIKSHSHKIVKSIMFLALLVAIPYKEFFNTSRMMIVSNLLSGVFLVGIIPFISKGKKKFKIAVAVIIAGIVILGLFKFSSHNALKSIVNFKRMVKVFKTSERIIAENIDSYNADERREVKIYNPNRVIDVQPREVTYEEVKVTHEEAKVTHEEIKEKIKKIHVKAAEERKASEEKPELSKKQIKQKVRKALGKYSDEEIEAAYVEQIKEEEDLAYVTKIKKERWSGFEEVVEARKRALDKSGYVEPTYYNENAVFRILIWRDMVVDLANEKPILGFDFGRPFRSKSLEILRWGEGDWQRDGWIGAHNSYLHMIYRTGVVGIALILSLLIVLFRMIKKFIALKSLTGILLCGIIINWFVAANFLLIFELPYTAIPIWAIYGLTLAYYHEALKKNNGFVKP